LLERAAVDLPVFAPDRPVVAEDRFGLDRLDALDRFDWLDC
jgi:hypothetical protein